MAASVPRDEPRVDALDHPELPREAERRPAVLRRIVREELGAGGRRGSHRSRLRQHLDIAGRLRRRRARDRAGCTGLPSRADSVPMPGDPRTRRACRRLPRRHRGGRGSLDERRYVRTHGASRDIHADREHARRVQVIGRPDHPGHGQRLRRRHDRLGQRYPLTALLRRGTAPAGQRRPPLAAGAFIHGVVRPSRSRTRGRVPRRGRGLSLGSRISGRSREARRVRQRGR